MPPPCTRPAGRHRSGSWSRRPTASPTSTCAIYKPFDFDPAKTYPVLDEIYPGPADLHRAAALPARRRHHDRRAARRDLRRSRVRGGGGRRPWARPAQQGLPGPRPPGPATRSVRRRPRRRHQRSSPRPGRGWTWTGSASTATRAAATPRRGRCSRQPDFFKVAVSSSGDHDDRVNHAWWGEKFFGLVDEFDYEAHVQRRPGREPRGQAAADPRRDGRQRRAARRRCASSTP